jgi:NHL repeat
MSKFSKYLRGVAALGLGVAGLLAIAGPSQAAVGDVTTFAGSGVPGNTNGQGVAATFDFPTGVASDSLGNLYVAEQSNNAIRKITPTGLVTTFAGSGVAGSSDGLGQAATFNAPVRLALDSANNVYVADRGNFLVRKITPAGLVSTLAGSGVQGSTDGLGALATFNGPSALVVDSGGNIFVTDSENVGNPKIRRITPAGLVSTFAGSGTNGFVDGQGLAASFKGASEMVIDSTGNIYLADGGNNAIRKITPTGLVSTFAGSGSFSHINGTGIAATFGLPQGLAIDTANNLYVGDRANGLIRKVTPSAVVTDFAGKLFNNGFVDGGLGVAQFNDIIGLGIDPFGNLFVADSSNNAIRKVEITAPVACGLLAPCPSSTTTTTPGGCVTGATVCSSTTTTTSPGCPLSAVCASSTTTTTTLPCASTSTTIDAAGVPQCLPSNTTTTTPDVTTTILPCSSASTTIDAAGVPRCLPATTTTTTAARSTTTTTGVVVSSSMVFPTIPPATTPGPTIPVPPTVLTFAAIPVVTATSPLPTLTVAALVEKSSIPQAPVPGPSVEGQVADFTPAYTGSSSTGSVVVAMVLLALGTLLLAGNLMRVAKRKAR